MLLIFFFFSNNYIKNIFYLIFIKNRFNKFLVKKKKNFNSQTHFFLNKYKLILIKREKSLFFLFRFKIIL
jgi:hypothetical protein